MYGLILYIHHFQYVNIPIARDSDPSPGHNTGNFGPPSTNERHIELSIPFRAGPGLLPIVDSITTVKCERGKWAREVERAQRVDGIPVLFKLWRYNSVLADYSIWMEVRRTYTFCRYSRSRPP